MLSTIFLKIFATSTIGLFISFLAEVITESITSFIFVILFGIVFVSSAAIGLTLLIWGF